MSALLRSTLSSPHGPPGWNVGALTRGPTPPEDVAGWTSVQGDALGPGGVVSAAAGVQAVVVHDVNPPSHRQRDRQVLPGALYSGGPDAALALREDAPQQARTRKGRICVALKQRLAGAVQEGVRSPTVRSGDFFGPRSGDSWSSPGMVRPGQSLTGVSNPGDGGDQPRARHRAQLGLAARCGGDLCPSAQTGKQAGRLCPLPLPGAPGTGTANA
nr:hypothetical protein [Deinococcus hopiensis]